ncbi:para-nitrobenzyl esterase [Caulobacter ginsengisoli]|uniref:Carboxylic ester hydrolase n=1 Tax=Caulobacter ginsengisoli TaxID=400775 RepID=A0ABU0IR11_9CAUL|nr:carboxylesterase family protein [Caulobacter ginsengisoli]MDQ0464448.1 para-nitrobenzyl esterase [Caulobacter ginsengisoli]
MIRRTAGALIAGLLALWPGSQASAQTGPIVRIDSGVLRGVPGPGVVSFKGIAYAAPPVGRLRWRPPQTAKAWKGVKAADAFGPICSQNYNPQDNGVGPLPASEDCLTLNVWTPGLAGPLKPVMVWIHGGGFVNGSASAPLYDGAALARQGVVVVTLNYRLGWLGFFAHPAISAEQPAGPLANYGLMDQIAALQWVQRNITAFGGDPDNVTLFGESAGGMSVNKLMTSPPARGLFHKAIVQSGLGRESAPRLKATNREGYPSAEAQGEALAARLGYPKATAAQLRGIPVEKILATGDPYRVSGWGPTIDGQILTADVDDAFQQGLEMPIPYLVGSNSLEFPPPGSANADRQWGIAKLPASTREAIAKAYGDEEALRLNLVSDVLFTEPARLLAGLHAGRAQTWLYRFSMVSPAARGMFSGAPHASERQYVFQTLEASTWPTGEDDRMVSQLMSAYWVAFAKTGDPNGGGRLAWPLYQADGGLLLDFTADGPWVGPAPNPTRLDAIALARAAR